MARTASWLLCAAAVIPVGAQSTPEPPALIRAAGRCDATAVGSLLAAGADPNVRAAGGRTALMAAAGVGCHAVVRALLVGGAARDARDAAGRTAFDDAVDRGQPDTIALLRDAS